MSARPALTKDQREEIAALVERRESLRHEVRALSTAALVRRFGVSRRTIERCSYALYKTLHPDDRL